MIETDRKEIIDNTEEMIGIKNMKLKININQKVTLDINKEIILNLEIKKNLEEIDLDLVLSINKKIKEEEILHFPYQKKNRKVHPKKTDPKEMTNLNQDLDQDIEIVSKEVLDIDLEAISIQIIQSISLEIILVLKIPIKRNAEIRGKDQKVIQHLRNLVQVIVILLDNNFVY